MSDAIPDAAGIRRQHLDEASQSARAAAETLRDEASEWNDLEEAARLLQDALGIARIYGDRRGRR